jgi:hypothetical protein
LQIGDPITASGTVPTDLEVFRVAGGCPSFPSALIPLNTASARRYKIALSLPNCR